jgi:putative transposase
MPWGLKRYYGTGALHFITFSCHERRPVLETPEMRSLLVTVLEKMRMRYRFVVIGYVIMPEHVHLLTSEPEVGSPSTVIQAIKLGLVRRVLQSRVPHVSILRREDFDSDSSQRLWMRRFYDFNVWSERKEIEKLRYMHRNPVVRGLVRRPEDWEWSSFRAYASGEVGIVRVNDWTRWEERIASRIR